MNTPRLLPLFLCVCGLVLAGCQTKSKLGELGVSLVDIKPLSGTVLESQVVVTLRFVNENIVPFGISGTSHKLYLNGGYVGKAVNNEPFGLQPLTTTTRDVTLMLENLALLQQVIAMNGQTSVSYRLENILFTNEGDDKVQLRSETKGTLDLGSLGARGR
ncbi:MAG: hypothetical protein KBF26_06350 [Opitutaceae bacterium]|nr:hypothetical protein [Opitutaceae bacterium]